MTLIERSWMTLVLLFMVLSSVKIKINQQHRLHQMSEQHATNLEISVFGANAMAMSFSMQMPPFMPMPPMAMPIPIPVKIPIIDLQQQKPQAPTYTQPQQPQQAISGCHCSSYNQQQQQPQPGCPPCPYINQYQQPQMNCQPCPYLSQQQQPQAGCPPCPYPQQQHQQQPQQCCQNNYSPSQIPQNRPSCVICRPGQSPQQPGHNGMVPVAQVVLTPVINRDRKKKCDSNESDDMDDDDDSEDADKDSDETDGCTRRCRRRLARMNAERRNGLRKHRRMIKRRFSKRELLDLDDDQRKGPVRPVLQYVARNGDIKYKTKISEDEAFELLGDNSVSNDKTVQTNSETLNNKPISLRKTFSNYDNAQSNIRLMRAGDPILLRNKVQHQVLNPGKKELVFQSPKGNEITNLSLTFLFS